MSRHCAYGDLIGERVSEVTIFETASRSCFLIMCSSASAWYCTVMLSDCSAVCTSLTQRFTTSAFTRMSWMPETSADAATNAFLSTSACLRWRSICASIVGSVCEMIFESTRMALAR